jgi:UDP-3-O-[3-hydroxymyristoyl] N-acetylglucosamine deacetylase
LVERNTVGAELTWSGVGVHTGQPCSVCVRPWRQGLALRIGPDRIPITPELACEDFRCTGLEANGVRIKTVEHLLAALNGLGVTDAEIEVEGPELPILDGSAYPYAEQIWDRGLEPLPSTDRPPAAPFSLIKSDSRINVAAGFGFLSVSINFENPAIGDQNLMLELTPERFMKEIAPARTFGFMEEAERLRAAGFAQGATLENTVVFSVDGPMGVLRFPDEPVRHKMLDLIGDLVLSGRSIYELDVGAERPGHAINTDAARRLFIGG